MPPESQIFLRRPALSSSTTPGSLGAHESVCAMGNEGWRVQKKRVSHELKAGGPSPKRKWGAPCSEQPSIKPNTGA